MNGDERKGWRVERHELSHGLWAGITRGFGSDGGGGAVPSEHGICHAGVTRLPAVKFVCLIPKPTHLSSDAFHRYWLENHGPLIQTLAPAMGISRYVQSHLVPSATIAAFAEGRGWSANPYEGVTEVWWESERRMQEALSSPAGHEASERAAADERNFSDGRVIVFTTREYVVVDGPSRDTGGLTGNSR